VNLILVTRLKVEKAEEERGRREGRRGEEREWRMEGKEGRR